MAITLTQSEANDLEVGVGFLQSESHRTKGRPDTSLALANAADTLRRILDAADVKADPEDPSQPSRVARPIHR